MVRIHGQRHFLSRKASKHIGYWLSRARHILPLFFGNMAAGDVSIIAALPSLSQEEKKSLASPSLYISQSAVIRYFAVMAAARRFPAPDSSCCEGGKEMGKCDFATEFSFWQSNHAAASLSDPSANISGRIYVAASTTLSIFRPIQCNSNHFWELKKKMLLA